MAGDAFDRAAVPVAGVGCLRREYLGKDEGLLMGFFIFLAILRGSRPKGDGGSAPFTREDSKKNKR